jgi:hypothetical protein
MNKQTTTTSIDKYLAMSDKELAKAFNDESGPAWDAFCREITFHFMGYVPGVSHALFLRQYLAMAQAETILDSTPGKDAGYAAAQQAFWQQQQAFSHLAAQVATRMGEKLGK